MTPIDATRGRQWTGAALAALLLLVALLPAARADSTVAAASVLLLAAAATAAATMLPRPTSRAIAIAICFLLGGIVVRLATGDTDLSTTWFLASLGGVGIGSALTPRGRAAGE